MAARMWFGIVSLFPEMFAAVTDYGVVGRAVSAGLIGVEHWNPRDFTLDRHRTVDDRPYGGGPGMLMKVEPLQAAIQAAKTRARALAATRLFDAELSGAELSGAELLNVGPQQTGVSEQIRTVYLSPQGVPLTQSVLKQLAACDRLILIAGRYEGVDERLIESEVDQEVSIGDFVLSGGELPAMVLIDALARLVPGVLGHQASAVEDSFVDGLLDCPHYTRPEIVAGKPVPGVLLSGNHREIAKWRARQSLGRTYQRRPDLLARLELDAEQRRLLEEFLGEQARQD
jgi:tRNA (guanine37-N1)-methyltransferase